MQQVIPGIDSFLSDPRLDKNSRFGMVTNNAAFTSGRILSRLALAKNGFNLIKIFSPEHGISVKGSDGVYQNHSTDIKTDLPIISLYGDRLMPTEEDFNDIEVVLFDTPDVGCRFYTYLWTMTYVMEACAKYNKQLIVLDRPNPIGGDLDMAEGPMLDEINCSSFIGRWSIPIRHSCTLGELANYFANKKVKGLDLKIIHVKNWPRQQMAVTPQFGFYPTSPAIQNISTAFVYPGMGLLEGINVNEGRGTDKPFLQFGAPWINANELNAQLFDKLVPGVKTIPCSYIPDDSVYKGEVCNGLELVITDEKTFKPVSTGIKLITLLFNLYPEHLRERAYVTNANPAGSRHLDKLLGIKNAYNQLKSGKIPITDITHHWLTEITPYLLYD
ncbi:MAG TPA: DUF1343 domain-containing protein [Chitinophagaceae bacterium]|nr:DUF1343 domain-containing protein [Chitinophagaceae bacterium]